MTPTELHVKVFGIEPVVIGLHWRDVHDRILDAVDRGSPYNEENELSPQDLRDFRAGNLLF